MAIPQLALNIAWIGAGGAAGSVLRYLIGAGVQRLVMGAPGPYAGGGIGFPFGTVFVNVSGCLAIGVLASVLGASASVREEHRLALLVGVLGGYTTFSTFGRETFTLVGEGRWMLAALNVLASNVLGLLAVWAGYRLAGLFGGADGGV